MHLDMLCYERLTLSEKMLKKLISEKYEISEKMELTVEPLTRFDRLMIGPDMYQQVEVPDGFRIIARDSVIKMTFEEMCETL